MPGWPLTPPWCETPGLDTLDSLVSCAARPPVAPQPGPPRPGLQGGRQPLPRPAPERLQWRGGAGPPQDLASSGPVVLPKLSREAFNCPHGDLGATRLSLHSSAHARVTSPGASRSAGQLSPLPSPGPAREQHPSYAHTSCGPLQVACPICPNPRQILTAPRLHGPSVDHWRPPSRALPTGPGVEPHAW